MKRNKARQAIIQQDAQQDELSSLLGINGKKKKPFKNIRLLIIAGTFIIAGIAALIILIPPNARQAAASPVYREYTVERGDIIVGQTESSSISLKRETITFPVSALVEEVYVKSGSSVKEGDALVLLNVDDIAAGLQSYELQLEIAGLELEQAKLQLETKLLQAKQKLESSREAGSLAGENKDITIAELQLALDKAKDSLATAQEDLAEYTELNTTFASDYSYLTKLESNVESLQSTVNSLQSSVNANTNYTNLVETAKTQLNSAWSQLLAAANALDANTFFLSLVSPSTDAATSLATDIGVYYGINTSSPGTLNGSTNVYTSARATAENWQNSTSSDTNANTLVTAFITALDKMDSEASSIRTNTQNISLQSQLTSAQSSLSSAQSSYNSFKTYYTNRYGNVEDAEALADKVKSLEVDVATAELNLDKANLSAQTGATSAEQQRESAVTEANNAKTTYELTEMELSQAVDAAQEKYNNLFDQIDNVKKVLSDDGIVYAPCNGMVSSVTAAAGDNIEVSYNSETKQISAYAQLLSMTNISEVYVPITISEEDILTVSIAQEAEVTMTAFTGQTFAAEVDTISVESARTGAATVSYNVTVRFKENNALDMYDGMSAEVSLIQRAVRDVIFINSQAVTNTEGKSTVLLKGADGQGIITEVKTGFTDGRYVEITEGLTPGDVVMVESAVGRS